MKITLKGIKVKKTAKLTSDREVYLEKICVKQGQIIEKLKLKYDEGMEIIEKQGIKIFSLQDQIKNLENQLQNIKPVEIPSPAPCGPNIEKQGEKT